MDTISSRESNTNYLPLAGVIAGVVALLVAIFAFVKINSLKNDIADLKNGADRISGVETQVAQAMNSAQQMANAVQVINRMQADLSRNATETNNAFKQVSEQLGELRTRLDRAETSRGGRPPVSPASQGGAVAQPSLPSGDEYVVKSGDIGSTIFRNTGFNQNQLEAVNPGIEWNRLRVGQKIKLPKK